jgi:colanic acid/amylovoran biosynthesis glycosyltransferase
MKRKLSIGIYLIAFPVLSEPYLVSRVLGLLDAGVDVHLFTAQPGTDWDAFPEIRSFRETLHKRIHSAPPPRPLVRVLVEGTVHLLITALRYPRAFARFVAHCWQHRHTNPRGFLVALYTRLNFVGAAIDMLHIEFDTQAYAVADLKTYLGRKLILGSWMPYGKTSVAQQHPDALPYLYQHVDAYHFASHYLLSHALEQGFDSGILHCVIPATVDAAHFGPPAPADTSSGVLRLITIGRLSPEKGYEQNLAAVAALHEAGIPVAYTIVGEGPARHSIEAEARHLGLIKAGIVTFRGAVPNGSLPDLLAQADVMLHLAHYEGFGICALEAQASSIPVVASKVGGLGEAIEDGVTGFLVAPGDVDAAVEKLMLLANDLSLRTRMGQAGRARVLDHFDPTQQIADYIAFYKAVAALEPAH